MLSNTALAFDNYAEVTQDSKIVQALDLLQHHSDDSRQTLNTILGDNLTQKPIKVMFYNLSQMNVAYANYDALTCKHKSGSIYILINKIHKDAPVEALACLLSHEVLHQDDLSSYQEEVQAWTKEATTWVSLKKVYNNLNSSELNTYPLVRRLNSIEKMYVKANYATTEISKEIHSNLGYQNLAEYSPGYGI